MGSATVPIRTAQIAIKTIQLNSLGKKMETKSRELRTIEQRGKRTLPTGEGCGSGRAGGRRLNKRWHLATDQRELIVIR